MYALASMPSVLRLSELKNIYHQQHSGRQEYHTYMLICLNMRASAHMHCRSCHPVITTMSTALPTCHLRCMSNKLIFLIHAYMS
jgi:hypothetical protein